MNNKKRAFAFVAVGGLAMLGVAAAVMTFGSPFGPRSKPDQPPDQAVKPLSGADQSKPPVAVGVATGYAPSIAVDTGPVDYSYIGPGWAYAGIKKDW